MPAQRAARTSICATGVNGSPHSLEVVAPAEDTDLPVGGLPTLMLFAVTAFKYGLDALCAETAQPP